jgi:hypothetical protein
MVCCVWSSSFAVKGTGIVNAPANSEKSAAAYGCRTPYFVSSDTQEAREIDAHCGFARLSKFAQAYKDRFREFPSQKLKNAK